MFPQNRSCSFNNRKKTDSRFMILGAALQLFFPNRQMLY